MQELAWVNGRTVPLREAVVPLEDRGFLFGDAVYEVARVYGGVPFCLEEHLQRLEGSAAAIMITLPYERQNIGKIALNLIRKSNCRDGWLYIQLTRGAAPRSKGIPPGITPTLVMFVRPLPPGLDEHTASGISCITLPDDRWHHCEIKSINQLPNILAREKARVAGAYEAILYRDGEIVTEATSSNVFALVGGSAVTPVLSNHNLAGITRMVVLNLLAEENIPVCEHNVTLDDLKKADEIWLSSTIIEILPVVTLDGKAVGSGLPGATTRRLVRRYREKATGFSLRQ